MLRNIFTLLGVVAFLTLVADTASAVAYRPYLITDIGSLGGRVTVPYDINESGLVAGKSRDSSGSEHAFAWSEGTMTDLGAGYDASFAKDVANDGTVMCYGIPAGTTDRELWTYKNGVKTLLSIGQEDYITPEGMNNNGVIVGSASGVQSAHAFLHMGGTSDAPINIGAGFELGSSIAWNVNDNGIVVGEGKFSSTALSVGFTYDLTAGTYTDYRTVVPGASRLFAINNQGWVVGFGSSGTFVSNGTTTHYISDVYYGYDINENGQVVGEYAGAVIHDIGTGVTTHLYDLLSDSGQSDWSYLTLAHGINEAGQVVGYGKREMIDTNVHGFVMTPTLFGDANIDGSVNGTDLNAVLSNYNATISGDDKTLWLAGDFNCDGSVNGTDLNTVLSNYNQSVSCSSAAAVPEPSTLLLILAALLSLWGWMKRFAI